MGRRGGDGEDAALFAHPRLAQAPNGTGDLVTASFGAGLIQGLAPRAAAERAARAASEAVQAAQDWRAPELPIVALGQRLVRPPAQLRIGLLRSLRPLLPAGPPPRVSE